MNQTFPCFRVSLLHFSESVFLIFRVRSFHVFGLVLSTFPSQSFSFFESDLPMFLGPSCLLFWASFSHISSNYYPFLEGQSLPVFGLALAIFLGQTFPFYLVNLYLISSSSSYSLWVWLEHVWLEMLTEIIFFNAKTGFKEILTNYFHVGFTYTCKP